MKGNSDMESQEDYQTTEPTEPTESVEPENEPSELHVLQKERDDAVEARTRALADYANFQRRAKENEIRERDRGVSDVARNLMPVLDQFDMALGQQAEDTSVESLLKGIEIVRDELAKALEKTGIAKIAPAIGDPFDPMNQEAMLQQPAEGVEPGHVSMLVQVGWAMGSQVLRPAKVAIAPEDA